MANLNLSEFTEKLFVADADHTFIWDTAASISKRVSRNSWLNSGELTSSAPVTISQTWNQIGTAFTAFKINAVSTASASGSLLADFQVGGASRVTINKSGETRFWKNSTDYTYLFPSAEVYGYLNSVGVATRLRFDDGGGVGSGSGLFLGNTGIVGWHSILRTDTTTPDTILLRDEQYHLALRNGTNGQKFSVYGTYPGAAWERFTITAPTSGNVLLGTYRGTGGIARGLEFQTDGVTRLSINTSGGATFTGNFFVFGGGNIQIDSNRFFFWQSGSVIANSSNGVIALSNQASTDFNRLQLGGTTDIFPAIARDGAGIKFTGAAAGSTSWIKVPPVAVSALALAATAGAGARAFVNDASAPVFGSAVTGGGAVLVPVYSDGSAWNVG